jgi:HAD superfamily hydrolase (TIGR01549 family)
MTELANALEELPIKALLFDLDDTLYDSKPIYAHGLENAWKAFKSSGFASKFGKEDFYAAYAAGREKTKRTLTGTPSQNSRLIYFHHLVCGLLGHPLASLIIELDHAYAKAYSEIDFEPARSILRALKASFKIAIVTNQTCQAQLAKLNKLDPGGSLVDVFITSEAVGFEKPDSRIFKAALEALNLPAHQCLMIGDHLENDIKGAVSLGMAALQVTNVKADPPLLLGRQPISGSIGTIDQLSHLLSL